MLTITLVLALCALVICIAHAMGKAPLWPAVLVLAVALMLTAVPIK